MYNGRIQVKYFAKNATLNFIKKGFMVLRMEKYMIADFDECEYCVKNPYGREPVIEIMPNGTIVCVMITGGPTEPHNENIVVITRSYDGGKTWSKPEKLFSHKS